MTETFLVTALPHSAAADAAFHLSLFVTHRLTPERAGAVLGEFPVTADWTTQVQGARLSLQGTPPRGGPVEIGARLLLDPLQPALWPRVFPADLPVGGWVVPDPTAVPWRTFAAHRSQQNALLVHALSIFSSPTTAPAPAGSALVATVLDALGLHERELPLDDILDGTVDRRVTEQLGAMLDNPRLRAGVREAPGVASAVSRALVDAHEARLYYQREEEQRPYAERPTPGAVPDPVPKPVRDFASRCASLGDLPRMLRALGLVLDVVVDDIAQLEGLTSVSASLVLPDGPDALPSPRTSCEVAGPSFTTPAASPRWHRSRLRVGDEAAFTLLDLDPDASALKLEQFLRNVPRLAVQGLSGPPANAAPASLRATGFALAEHDRATGLRDRVSGGAAADAALLAGQLPPLVLEQVTRGLRLEVWDDVSRDWHSLHWRSPLVTLDGEPVLSEEPEQGFLQGASLTSAGAGQPKHAHEVLAGWDGWSLAVPPPGGVVMREDEGVQPAPPVDPDPVHPVAVVSRLVPGTLPRLRYGRSYSFRAWAVDLAGNSRPPDAAPVQAVDVTAATELLRARSATATGLRGATEDEGSAARTLRDLRPAPVVGLAGRTGLAAGRAVVADTVTGMPELDRLVASRGLTRSDAVTAVPRSERVAASFTASLAGSPALMDRVQVRPETYAEVLRTSATAPGVPAADLVTAPRPFLRWDPVLEPVVVPRYAYTTGESLLRLVVRSGVDEAGTVTDPGTYAAAHPGLGWREDSQRHLSPPKTSQLTAEQHGRFDEAIGGGSSAERRRALALAMRESGSYLETTVADLVTPGARLPQPGVAFHVGPTADPPEYADPADLPKGDPPSSGQYVAHDVDSLVVPYLPDPLAAGVSMVFPDARPGGQLGGLLAVEGTTVRYPGHWPSPAPYRLVLTSGPELDGRVDGDVLTIAVPPGEQLRVRLSSSLDAASLPLLGLWRSLPAALTGDVTVAEAAADGWFWWLTPATEIVLVHAVPRPVFVPRVMSLLPVRAPGSTATTLLGAVDVHGPSTDRLDIEAAWSEWHDDPAKPGPERLDQVGVACGTSVGADEDLVVLTAADGSAPQPDGSALRLHGAQHAFGDTRHRLIEYTARATTRYREFFPNDVLVGRDDMSLVSAPRAVSVPSSARPGRVSVRDVLPLFRWSEVAEPGQPFATQRTRRAGLRLYLDRPWYTTGDGEQLAVLLAADADVSNGVKASVSSWGGDPVWAQEGPRSEFVLPLSDLLHLSGLDDRREPGRPAGPPVQRQLVDLARTESAWLLPYDPEFSPERQLWFVDVALDPGTALWPFVKLAVARYQPDSLPGLHLGPVTVCDWAQLAPERTTSVARTDASHVEVAVSGAVGIPLGAGPRPDRERVDFAVQLGRSRTVRARLERRVPEVGTDLGWEVLSVATLPVRGVAGLRVTWAGTLDVPSADPHRPGTDPDLRVVVEEEERLRADPSPEGQERTSSRICYADVLAL